jgi:hypothetical protein
MAESWRVTRRHPVLGTLYLHNRNGVWWQSELEFAAGHSIRFDLEADHAPGGVDCDALFTRAADFVLWARGAGPKVKATVIQSLLAGDYRCPHPEASLSAVDQQALDSGLRLTTLEFYPSGSSDWKYQSVALFGNRRVLLMLNADREIKPSPVIVY